MKMPHRFSTVSATIIACAWPGVGVVAGCSGRQAGGSLDGGNLISADAGPGSTDAGPRPDVPAAPFDGGGPCEEVVDVVFVLDVSSSMKFVLDELESGIGEVVTAANALAEDAHFGLVPFVDNFRIDDTGDREAGVVHTTAATLQAAFRNYRSTYTEPNRNPGDGPTGPTTQNPICEENAIDALYAAARDYPWRPNATRVIIVATDDTFLEAPDNYGDRDGDGRTDRTDYPSEGNYPALRTFTETLAALQGARIRVFGFTRLAAPGPWDLQKCGTGRRLPWESVSDGWSTNYGSNAPLPTQTDGNNFDIDEVRMNRLSLTETINNVVIESYCEPPLF